MDGLPEPYLRGGPFAPSPCAEAEAYVAQLHRDHPDGVAVDARDLPGYHPPASETTGDGTRDASGRSLADYERLIKAGRWPTPDG